MNLRNVSLRDIGSVLLGVGVFIIAIVFADMYYDEKNSIYTNPFFAECYSDLEYYYNDAYKTTNYVVIKAYDTIFNVTVQTPENMAICKFDIINKGSSELCNISNNNIVKINAYYKGNLTKGVVVCGKSVVVEPIKNW